MKADAQIFKRTRQLKGAKMVGISIDIMQLWISKHVLCCMLCVSPVDRSLHVARDRDVSSSD